MAGTHLFYSFEKSSMIGEAEESTREDQVHCIWACTCTACYLSAHRSIPVCRSSTPLINTMKHVTHVQQLRIRRTTAVKSGPACDRVAHLIWAELTALRVAQGEHQPVELL